MMLASLNDYDIAMAAITSGMTVVLVWIIAYQWRKTRVAAYNARLKQLMIERGMSAAEIERVLTADGNLDAGRRPPEHRPIGLAFDRDCCTEAEHAKRG
jgi:hypothetical protein